MILAVWKLPSLLYGDVRQASADARLQAASGFRTAFVAGLAGLAALGSLAIANRTYRLTQQGQITDRYTKAIEQLGDDKLDVRLGGIYALERIATDSERDHPTVVEVLSAFVREHSQPSTGDDDNVGDDSGGPLAPPPKPVKREPTADVQAAVTVLGRLPQRRHVTRGNLKGAHLEGANLDDANLEGATLADAHLEGASLDWANLQRANLQRAHLAGAYLQHAHLAGADLGMANLEGALLGGAILRGAHLHGANLEKVWLQWAHLEGADLKRANLESAQLWGTKLQGANLDGAQLQGATYDADTVWPDEFDWKAAGVILQRTKAARSERTGGLDAGGYHAAPRRCEMEPSIDEQVQQVRAMAKRHAQASDLMVAMLLQRAQQLVSADRLSEIPAAAMPRWLDVAVRVGRLSRGASTEILAPEGPVAQEAGGRTLAELFQPAGPGETRVTELELARIVVERAFRPDAGDLDAKLAELLIEGEDPDDDGGDDDDPAEMRPAAEGVNGADSFPEPALEPEEPDRPPLARKPEVDEVAEA